MPRVARRRPMRPTASSWEGSPSSHRRRATRRAPTAPPDAANRLLMGVQPGQLPAVREWLRSQGFAQAELYPMVRGRVVEVNGTPVSEASYADERARRLVEREFNLSFMESLPGHNAIAAGRWLDPNGAEFSVEQGIAQRLGWKLGDEIAFNIGGELAHGRITSLRRLRWDSMKVNFFVIAPPRVLEKFATS